MYQCLTQKDTLLYIIKSGVYRWPALKIKQHQNLVFHLNRHCLLPKNGATPNFVEFKDENQNVVASISTSGDLNVAGSITVNGEGLLNSSWVLLHDSFPLTTGLVGNSGLVTSLPVDEYREYFIKVDNVKFTWTTSQSQVIVDLDFTPINTANRKSLRFSKRSGCFYRYWLYRN